MTLKLLSKQELQFLNKKKLKYDLATAEKDYMLALTMDIINKSNLKDSLVFKGGTAIHHCYLDQSRFSEDLDFTSADRGLDMKEVAAVFEGFDFYDIKEKYETDKSLKINRLKYNGPLGLPNSIKIEIDKYQNVALAPVKVPYNNEWIAGIAVKAMDVMEIVAEKVRATSQRARYRDFYDLVLLHRKYNFNVRDIEQLIRKKEVRSPIGGKYALESWEEASKESTGGTGRIYYSEIVEEKEITGLLKLLDFDIKS